MKLSGYVLDFHQMAEDRKCSVCGEGTTREKGEPARYGDTFAHYACAWEKGFSDTQSNRGSQSSEDEKD
jgi:hypothetical protein